MSASLWDRRVVPHLVEWACGANPVRRQRAKIVPGARGRVLELGVGSGLNFAHYDSDAVTAVVAIDPSRELLERARVAARDVPFEVTFEEASAEALPVDDASFDTVVVTYSLCSIPDVAAALLEARRALRADGSLRFVEHGLAPDADVARWQRRLDRYWTRCAGGCHLDRDVPALLAAAGFALEFVESLYLPGPRWLNYNTWGVARPG
ncbi:MAG: class I SAM-dependent methyltransferase [Sandaracinaceae bacterium]|nr:class I SAM-dependent methyltransferase [Sandaracinaceae bacterium]